MVFRKENEVIWMKEVKKANKEEVVIRLQVDIPEKLWTRVEKVMRIKFLTTKKSVICQALDLFVTTNSE